MKTLHHIGKCTNSLMMHVIFKSVRDLLCRARIYSFILLLLLLLLLPRRVVVVAAAACVHYVL